MTALESDGQAANASRRYYREVMRVPLLTVAEEQRLARRWRKRKDEVALHRLVSAHVRLAMAVAARYRNYGLPMADMVQEGNVGLMQAAMRFEPERKVRFSTYATWWIRAAIQDYVLRNWSIVRTGTSAGQKALFFNLRWLRAKIERDGTHLRSDEFNRRIATALKVAPREVEAMSGRLLARDQSLNDPVGVDGLDEWQDFLPDPEPNPEERVAEGDESRLRRRWLNAALGELTPREQHILRERVLRDEHATLAEIGVHLGVTKERVRQIEHKALAKLRQSVLRRSREAPGAPKISVS